MSAAASGDTPGAAAGGRRGPGAGCGRPGDEQALPRAGASRSLGSPWLRCSADDQAEGFQSCRTPLAGTAYLARRFGTLPVYQVSLIAFTVASALCALAPDATVLVAARVIPGPAAAPLVMSMLLGRGTGAARSISPLAGIMLFLGPALGPTVGGALITWAPLAAGAVLLAGYAGWALHREQPALDLSLAR